MINNERQMYNARETETELVTIENKKARYERNKRLEGVKVTVRQEVKQIQEITSNKASAIKTKVIF